MRSVKFAPDKGLAIITTDQNDLIDILIGGLEMKIVDAAKDGRYEDCIELCTMIIDLEKCLDLISIYKTHNTKKEEETDE